MLLIYTHYITPRITYTFDLVFNSALKIPYELTTDRAFYELHIGNKFAYTNNVEGFTSHINSHSILFETSIRELNVACLETKSRLPVFFESSTQSIVTYDVFATVFYFATRYEEFGSSQLDKHQRFQAEQSLFYKHQLLQKPFLNILINDFLKKLINLFPSLSYTTQSFKSISTIDIDNAFAFAHKGFRRNVGGAFKDVLQLNFSQLVNRIKSNLSDRNDPYNTFELIERLHQQSNVPLAYFVLIGDYSTFDKNPHFQNPHFRKLLKSLSLHHELGLHPSYITHDSIEKIAIEKKRLEDIIEKKITSARCHFLRIKLPQTYRAFIDSGITDDYTMIYASQSGFRTGLGTPHKWFDLEKNEATTLTIHPSIVMEGTLRDYNKLNKDDASNLINNLITEIKNVNGEFVSVWHNDSFTKENADWIEVYKTMLQELVIK